MAVFDHDAERFNDFALEYAEIMGLSEKTIEEIRNRKNKIEKEIRNK